MPKAEGEKRKEYNEQRKAYYQENREAILAKRKAGYHADPEAARAREHARRRADPISLMLSRAKGRAKARGMEFTITRADLKLPERCPYLDIEIRVCDDKICPSSPSLDRIDNSQGYIPGNVEVISNAANAAKGNLTEQQLILFAKNILKKFDKGDTSCE